MLFLLNLRRQFFVKCYVTGFFVYVVFNSFNRVFLVVEFCQGCTEKEFCLVSGIEVCVSALLIMHKFKLCGTVVYLLFEPHKRAVNVYAVVVCVLKMTAGDFNIALATANVNQVGKRGYNMLAVRLEINVVVRKVFTHLCKPSKACHIIYRNVFA